MLVKLTFEVHGRDKSFFLLFNNILRIRVFESNNSIAEHCQSDGTITLFYVISTTELKVPCENDILFSGVSSADLKVRPIYDLLLFFNAEFLNK